MDAERLEEMARQAAEEKAGRRGEAQSGGQDRVKDHDTPATYHFREVFSDGSVCGSMDCEFCNRHYVILGTIEDPAKVEEMRQLFKTEPDKWIEADEWIETARIDGRTLVVGCPCNILGRYEQFVWRYRQEILAYLGARCADRLESCEVDMKAVRESQALLSAYRDAKHKPEFEGRQIDLDLQN
jgi:hypothetical protein